MMNDAIGVNRGTYSTLMRQVVTARALMLPRYKRSKLDSR